MIKSLQFIVQPTSLADWVASHYPAERKAFGITSEPLKVSYWKAFDQRRRNFIPAVRTQIMAHFTAERKLLVAEAGNAGTPAAVVGRLASVLEEQQASWHRLYRVIYTTVGAEFGVRVFAGFKAGREPLETKQDEVDITAILEGLAVEGIDATVVESFFNLLPSEVLAYLQETAGTKIVGIVDETLRQVRNALVEGVEAGEGIDALAARIRKTYAGFDEIRAERIARTEVLSSSNFGSRTGALAVGIPLEKQWLTSRDDRVRETHIAVDGQIRGLNEPYIVGGHQLMFPLDSSLGANASEIINCRCVEVYQKIET